MPKHQEEKKKEGETRTEDVDGAELLNFEISDKLEKISQSRRLILIEVPKDVENSQQFDLAYLNGAEIPLNSIESQEIQTEEGSQFKFDSVKDKIKEYVCKQLIPLFPATQDNRKVVFKRSIVLIIRRGEEAKILP